MAIGSERACLAIADVSGYTGYLAGVELDHAQDILADLIGTVVEAMAPFELSKLEGDAAFALLSGEAIDGSLLQDVVEGTYVAFRKRLRDIRQASRCECNACILIPQLDLKLIVHHGIVARQRIAGLEELVGSDVILVHRLLKNGVTAATGIAAYALYTQAAIEAAAIDPVSAGLRQHHEETDVAGKVTAWVRDLEAVWREILARPHHVIPPEAVVGTWEYDVPVPPQVAWEYITSPIRRPQWTPGVTEVLEMSPAGRRGAGTTNHCMHGKDAIIEEILDWQPPRYWMTRSTFPPAFGGMQALMSDELGPLPGGGTHVTTRVARAEGADAAAFASMAAMMEQGIGAIVASLKSVLEEVARERSERTGVALEVPRSAERYLTSPVARGAPGATASDA